MRDIEVTLCFGENQLNRFRLKNPSTLLSQDSIIIPKNDHKKDDEPFSSTL
jgi:hypothetical protein